MHLLPVRLLVSLSLSVSLCSLVLCFANFYDSLKYFPTFYRVVFFMELIYTVEMKL